MEHDTTIVGSDETSDVGVIVAAWGRPEMYINHLSSIGKSSVGLRVEYSVGTTDYDCAAKCEMLMKHTHFASAVHCSPVKTSRAWPLPLAYNAALNSASAEILVIVGSEVCIPPGLLRDAMSIKEGVARQYTTNDAGGAQYVGPTRRVAFPYCMAIHRRHLCDIGGWDEAYADGIGFDDNDLAARLLVSGVRFEWCDEFRCKHQSHGSYHGDKQVELGHINQAIWRSRLNGYDGPLWPVVQGNEGGFAEQDVLAKSLASHGFLTRYTQSPKGTA